MVKIVKNHYLNAWQILYGEWISINTCETYNDEDDYIILQSHNLPPDEQIIKHQGWEALSNEAKEVIDMILNSPSEIIDFLSTPIRKKRLNKNNIKKYFRTIWRSKFITDKTIDEIIQWIKQL